MDRFSFQNPNKGGDVGFAMLVKPRKLQGWDIW